MGSDKKAKKDKKDKKEKKVSEAEVDSDGEEKTLKGDY